MAACKHPWKADTPAACRNCPLRGTPGGQPRLPSARVKVTKEPASTEVAVTLVVPRLRRGVPPSEPLLPRKALAPGDLQPWWAEPKVHLPMGDSLEEIYKWMMRTAAERRKKK